MVEQRKHERHLAWFPVRISGGAHDAQMGITHNASQRGILLVSNVPLVPGESVTITFRVAPVETVDRTVVGRVIRTEDNTEDPDGLWPYRMALEFEAPVPELDALLATAARSSIPPG